MTQRLIFGIFLIQITFSIVAMENKLTVLDFYGDIVRLEEWKIKESIFLSERKLIQDNLRLNKPIYAELVSKKELELFSKALNWKADLSLLYNYVRLPCQERHMLLDVVSKSKLQAEELEKLLTTFYVTGLYMKELIELQKNPLFDVGEEVVDAGNKIIKFIGNEEKNEENYRLYDGYYDDAIVYAKKHGEQ